MTLILKTFTMLTNSQEIKMRNETKPFDATRFKINNSLKIRFKYKMVINYFSNSYDNNFQTVNNICFENKT